MSLDLNEDNSREPRTLVWSQRNIQNFVYNSCLYEFEDIIAAVDRVDTIAPEQYDLLGRGVKKIVKSQTRQFPFLTKINPYRQKISLAKDYDVFFTIIDFPWNISSINLLDNRRDKSKFSVCYLIELWRRDIPQLKNFLEFFQDFDLICLGHSEIVAEVEAITKVPCMYLAPGVDTVKFYPNPQQQRSIDLANLGRRSDITHQALLELAETSDFFYFYEYSSGSDLRNSQHQHHRTLVANTLKSSRYFITNHAKINQPEQTQGQIEIGYRFFEGAAAGSVLLGCPPKNKAFEQYFNWDNAVIPIAFDEPSIADTIAELDAQPELLQQIQTNNVVNSLRQHDWVYRWEQVLTQLGLSSTEVMEERKIFLQQLAQAHLSSSQSSPITTENPVPAIELEQLP
ncbi:MAG: glycosyltransferase [Cyanobacteria bacterium J06623_7]